MIFVSFRRRQEKFSEKISAKKARRKRSSDLVAVWKFLTALSRDDKKGDVSCQGPVQLSLSIDCAGEIKVSDFLVVF